MSYGGDSSLPILVDDLKCKGTEKSLLFCRQSRSEPQDCTHLEDAGVKCRGMHTHTHTHSWYTAVSKYPVKIGIIIVYCVTMRK